MIIDFSTALSMSYTVRQATVAAVKASISTPVGPVVATVSLSGELDDAAAARLLRWCEARLHLHDSGQVPVGHLLNDPGLYYDLRRLTTRLDSLTIEFRRNPRKFINLEIF